MKYERYVKKCYVEKLIYGVDDMKIGYEESIDDLAIILQDDYKYDTSIEVDTGFIIDVDKNGTMCAIEILDCSKRIGKTKDYVKKAKIEAFVEVYDFSYKIVVSFNDGEAEIEQRVLK